MLKNTLCLTERKLVFYPESTKSRYTQVKSSKSRIQLNG